MDLMCHQKEKLKYPKSTWYIVVYEFCERFTFFGLKTVLVLYLTRILKFDGDESTIIYHSFIFLSYFIPLPCAILGDSYWGKYKTIIWLSSIYVVGCIVFTGASIANMFSLDVQKILAFLGLFSISVGTGGVKPCIFAFGGDQFQLPQQEKHLQHFATKFTLAVYTGSLISTFLMPELRHSIHCFGRDTCFPLAFGVPTIMMFFAIVIFVVGKNTYVKKKPENNVLTSTGNTTEIPSGQGRIYIYNGFDCHVFVQSKSLQLQNQIGPLEMFNVSHTVVSQNSSEDVMVVGVTLRYGSKCNFVLDNYEFTTNVTIIEGKEISYHLARLNSNTIALNRIGIYDSLVKEKFGNPYLRVLFDHTFDFDDNIILTCADQNSFTSYSLTQFRGMNFHAIKVGKYNVFYNGKMLPTPTMDIIPATFYTLTLQRNGDKMDVRLFTKDEGNYIHILWQLPQYLCMSIADIIFMVTIIKFAFTEAPKSMKSSIAAISLLTMALGNLLVVIISTISIKNQAHEFLLYSGLMLADTLLLGYFSVVYRSKNIDKIDAMTSNEHKMEETTVSD